MDRAEFLNRLEAQLLDVPQAEREEALQYSACALGAELMAMEAEQGPFNLTRYGEFLDSLPEMPWAE